MNSQSIMRLLGWVWAILDIAIWLVIGYGLFIGKWPITFSFYPLLMYAIVIPVVLVIAHKTL